MALSPFKTVRFPSFGLGLQAQYCPFVRPSTLDEKSFASRWHPNVFTVRDKYSSVRPDVLTWRVVSATSHKLVPKAVMRNRLKRRWANAFADSMRNNGLHTTGRPLSVSKRAKNAPPKVQGTLEMLVFSASGLHVSYDKLLKATDVLVKTLLRGDAKLSPESWPKPQPVYGGRKDRADSRWSIVAPVK
ncbi:hypothetical protein PV08_11285 [Exophiala spinifera]|uniref:Uncharacterized protein n=1 Tax=Exophiala spinifera TaxID=91928 RepID=A0A0D2AU98_9EURO|nr:uncharacterized protein PV08_11285 [Exophiala spinifera]KIW10323.1 hypothetical protein PV08_11285 [Exophiala spinifera]